MSDDKRTLWYHPESECYIEVFGEVDDSTAMECVEVTNEVLHELKFREQKNAS